MRLKMASALPLARFTVQRKGGMWRRWELQIPCSTLPNLEIRKNYWMIILPGIRDGLRAQYSVGWQK